MMYDHHTIMYDDVWCCVMYRSNPKTRVWTYGAWGEGGVQHGKLRRVTQHLDRLRRCLRFRFCQGVRLRVGESKVTWKKDLNTKFDSHHTSTHVITSTHIDKDGISQFTPSRNHKIWEKQGKCKPENNTTRKQGKTRKQQTKQQKYKLLLFKRRQVRLQSCTVPEADPCLWRRLPTRGKVEGVGKVATPTTGLGESRTVIL